MKSFFISSTFKDMQSERDILHQEIFPSLRRRLKEYGEDVQELDLRWGVDTSRMSEEESGRHVIESCIDAIDRCRPYMVILIGERYGWIPEKTVIEQAHDARLDVWYRDEISITQMEILYGALADDELDHCVFCFRDPGFMEKMPEKARAVYEPESPGHKEKLDAFKKKIRANSKALILEYSPSWDEKRGEICGLEPFRRQLEEMLWNLISGELSGKAPCGAARILQDARVTCAGYMGSYVPRFRDHENTPYILTGRSGVWITGEAGCGKSANMSSIAMSAAKVGVHVFLYFCGNENCGSKEALLGALLQWLLKEYPEYNPGTADTDSLSDRQKIQHIRCLLTQERTCDRVILIDAADQMEEDISDMLLFLCDAVIREEAKGCRFGMAVSSLPGYFAERHALGRVFALRKMEPFHSAEVNAFVQMHAERRGKHVDAKVVYQIRRKPERGNPYYLSLLMQKLFMMSREEFEKAERLAPGMEGLSLFMQREVAEMPDDIPGLTVSMLQEASEKLGVFSAEVPGAQSAPVTMLKALAVSDRGLKLSELERVMELLGQKMLPMNMERFFSYLFDSFGEDREGRWNFKHRLSKECVLREISPDERKRLARAISAQKTEDGDAACGFAYAVQAGDGSLAWKNLSAMTETIGSWEKECFRRCARILRTDGEEPFRQIAKADEIDVDVYAEALARSILAGREQVLRGRSLWKKLYDLIRGLGAVSDRAEFYLKLAGNDFYSYSLDKKAHVRQWKETAAAYRALRCPGKEENDAFYIHLLRTMPMSPGSPLWKEMGQCVESVRRRILEQGADLAEYGIQTVSQIPAFYAGRGQAERAEKQAERTERQAALKEYRAFLAAAVSEMDRKHEGMDEKYDQAKRQEGKDAVTEAVYSALRGQQAALTLAFRDAKCSQAAFDLAKEIFPWYQERMLLFPTLEERYQYTCILEALGSVVKESFSLRYRRAELTVWKKLSSDYGFEAFRDFYAYRSCDMGRFLEKTDRNEEKSRESGHAGEISACYARAVSIYDEMLRERTKEDPTYIWVLESSLMPRYARVCHRLEGDIWTWKDERSEMFAAEPLYPCETPEFFRAQMDGDLEMLEKETAWLYRDRDPVAAESQMGLICEKGAEYYDMVQDEGKAVLWCEKIMTLLKNTGGEISPARRWGVAGRFFKAARIFCRWGKYDEAQEAADLSGKMLSGLDAGWAEKKGYSRQLRMMKGELYLIKASAALSRKDPEGAAAFLRLAGEQTGEEEERQIRLYAACIRGKILCASGEKEQAAEVLGSAAKYWPRNAFLRTVFANEREVQEQFEFLTSQELRGRITCDRELLDKVAGAYGSILNNCTENGDASKRPLLLKQARQLSGYYRERGWSLPDALEDILAVTEKVREERRLLKLEKEQEKIVPDMGAEAGEFKKRMQEKMNLLFEMGKILSKYPERKEKLADNFLQRIRLMDQCAEKYRKDGYAQGEAYIEREALIELWQACSRIPGTAGLEELWERYETLPGKRDSGADQTLDRSVQSRWREVMDCCAGICREAFRSSRDMRWAERLTDETARYRKFLEKSRKENPGLAELLKEYAFQSYEYSRRMYMEMGKTAECPAWRWLVPYLEAAESQLESDAAKRGEFYPEILEELYELQGYCRQFDMYDEYAGKIQDLIDRYSSELTGADYELQYYMLRAVRDLGAEADIGEVSGYIEKLREQTRNAELTVN
ncbi:DUF4062 domain-containing protein [Ruminococcus sp. CLA-AA-H200]|uniref:DUF4062 domain-containing protein n=1 Tax=Ruminococcus turbiniformis TaxID=2881258 RepID=A0ABS8FY41_9FIRM|nr:DUF4062 domain-containing protein [Ruminococcus turbiniformis]MCC2254499.1 DUF4062 domain-containing protein [Ruminococcus turbiniformis]